MKSSKIILGIDAGTSSCKVVAFNHIFEVLCDASFGYKILNPRKLWVEQNPEEIWEAVKISLKKETVYQKESSHLLICCFLEYQAFFLRFLLLVIF